MTKRGGSVSSSTDSSASSDSSSSIVDEITGTGTEKDPYVISSAKQFKDFAAKYAALTASPTAKEYYTLGADIDLAGDEVGPIGTKAVPFNGYFSGNQHKIKGVSIKTFNKSTGAYGLFGYTSSSVISDLYVGIDYDLSLLGSNSYYYVGGLVGYAYNTYIYNVAIEGSIDLTSGQNSSSVLSAGGLTGISVAGGNAAVAISNCSVFANINCDMSDSDDVTNVVGGITGALSTLNDSKQAGVEYILSSYYNGNITGGSAVGGITAMMSYYASVVDCYAEGSSLNATDEGPSYVGGIVGQGYYETAVLHNYSSFETIDAGNSTAYYKSYAGTTIGYAYSNGYEYSSDVYGTINYGNAAASANITSDKVGVNGIEANKGEAGIKAAGLSSVWSIEGGEVSLNTSYARQEKAEILLDANYDGGEKYNKTVKIDAGDYDYDAISEISSAEFAREHYSYVGLFYDKDGKQPYAWYTPFVADSTLYASYGDLSLITGTWDYVCGSTGGTWFFDENNFYWQNRYYETFKYSYVFDGTYIFIGKGGSYEGEIFKYENGKITGYDMTDSDYQYVGTKSSSTFVIPDYAGEAFLGEWYFTNSSHVTLKADGTASATVETSTVTQTGGFTKLADGTFNIRVPGKFMGDGLHYDATNDIFFNATYFGAREKVVTTYATSDSSLKIYCTASKNYAIANGEEVVSYTGELKDGGEITVNGVTYSISGTTLTKKDTTPSIPADICGTYKSSEHTLVLNQDGTGSWDGTAFTWSYDATENKANISSFDPYNGMNNYALFQADGSVKVHMEDDYMSSVLNNHVMTKEGDSTTAGYVGTWIATRGSTSYTIVLNENKTGTYNGTAITYTESNGTITFSCGDTDVELKYDSTTGKMTGKYIYDYSDYEFDSVIKQADGGDDKGDSSSFYGTYTDSNKNTMVLNDDGTGSWNGTAFTYTYDETTKTGKINDFTGFDDGENSFTVNDDGTISIHLSGDYGDNIYNATMTKQATTTVPAYVGTWTAGSNTMVLNDDGTGSWNGTAFTYTYDETTKTGKINDFTGFDDGENSFTVNDDGTISIHLSGDYGDNVYNATMTKQA